MIWPSQIGAAVEAGAKVIILVDDFLGSGKQAEGFCKNSRFAKWQVRQKQATGICQGKSNH